MLFWTEPEYLIVAAIWLVGLGLSLKQLLVWRRTRKAMGKTQRPVSMLLSVWMLAAFVTSLELGFATFADSTDAFNMTNISKRWFRRYVEPQRNRDGFRDARECAKQLPEGTQRIIFFGDSFTIGHGLRRMQDRFSDRIEASLNAGSTSPQWQCANLGECGWDVSSVESLMKAALQEGYSARVFVYAYMINDIEGYDPRTTEAIKVIQQQQPRNWLWTRTYFFNWLYFRWQQYQAGRTVDYFPHLKNSYRSPAWEGVKTSLREMRQQTSKHDIELRMVLFPFMHDLGPEYSFREAHQQIVDFCRAENIKVLDLEPMLSAHRQEGLIVGRFDNHPNEKAHALAAEAILRDLLSDLRPTK